MFHCFPSSRLATHGVMAAWAMGKALAAPVLGNLAIAAADSEVPVTLHSWQAASFKRTEDAGLWRVGKVTLRLAQQVPNVFLTVRIVGEEAFRPAWGDVLAAFQSPSTPITAAAGPVEFMANVSPAPVLVPGRTYWLVVGVTQEDPAVTPGTGLFFWSYAHTSATDPGTAAGWQFGLMTASAGTLGANWIPEATTPFTFSIDAVPEGSPVTLAVWRLTHPGGPEAHADFLTSDTDRDGRNGLLEFALNSSPIQATANDAPAVPVRDSSGRFGLEFIRWAHAPELRYEVQTSSNLTSWHPPEPREITQQIEPLADGRERVRIHLLGSSPQSFLRLRISFL